MAKTVTLRIGDDVYERFVRMAEAERRSLGKFIEHAAVEYTTRTAFVGDDEMRGIFENEGLVRRLRQGVADAKHKRGRFVP